MTDIIDLKFSEWSQGKSSADARVSIYYKIRDIPYAVIPDVSSPEQCVGMLQSNRGSCTPKHLLMCEMYHRLGLEVLYAVYPFRWDDFEAIYSSKLKKLAQAMPLSHHLACRVDINGNLVLVDATLDPALQKLGLPVNHEWDGRNDTLLAVKPCGDEQLYHPSEAFLMQPRTFDDKALAFYDGFNSWLDEIRQLQTSD